MPTLVLVGEKSPTWFHNSMKALTLVLPNARLAIAERQTHMIKPEILAPELTRFYAPSNHLDGSILPAERERQPTVVRR